MALRLATQPNFTQASTEAEINFTTGQTAGLCYILPQTLLPFAPELGEVARIKPEFDKQCQGAGAERG